MDAAWQPLNGYSLTKAATYVWCSGRRRQEICQAWFKTLLVELPFALRAPWFEAGFRDLSEPEQRHRTVGKDPDETTAFDGGNEHELPGEKSREHERRTGTRHWCFASRARLTRLGILAGTQIAVAGDQIVNLQGCSREGLETEWGVWAPPLRMYGD